ncbi:DUF3153 domain-containing protein [Dolichospermum sp. ST_sed3]|nr:DUF3153 domain-containing protein [Dolichospermum sp. ST_sed3]MDD1445355.1 DUF3153 domain-containing protein [Dolichospermum sp. ST_sed8]MDD1454567.1 DUF3153 domain-containing protein [Dolichospermum sp. ST_sed7]MDD1461700.1 DUF3153 domain-containing protein [Dolichospermum sp. ST_sed2]MDD1465505.1 DUF3153 domain-containing protein [Dolichospermum sp. ST_sed5]MDD1472854.1 DUF3153 domain-containing protein [Dolichospermum sp. ST_sed4]
MKSVSLAIIKIKPIVFMVMLSSLLLSGCMKYDLGVNFNSTNNGELVQHIQLSEKITIFSSDYLSQWLKTLENRARTLAGSIERVSPTEIIVKIPFTSAKELQEKFTGFFNTRTSEDSDGSEISNITSTLVAEDTNFFLLSRNHLVYDLDLRSLAMLTTKDDSSIVNLDFSLQTPWGIKNIDNSENAIQPEKHDNQLIWTIKPGAINHIDVVFWLPNFLGIGTLLIIGFVWLGLYLRYTFLPNPSIQ